MYMTVLTLMMAIFPLFSRAQVKPESYSEKEGTYCPPCDPCDPCPRTWSTGGPNWTITPNGGPCVDCGINVFITGDFLYWTAREDQLAFAIKEEISNGNGFASVVGRGRSSRPSWNYRPGFRIGIGLLQQHDGWDISADYTWQRFCTDTKTLHADVNERITLQPPQQFTADVVSTSWRLHFNVIHLDLGRNFFISQFLLLRPHFGFAGTFQCQDFPIEVKGNTLAGPTFIVQFQNEMDYWGVGIRAGLDTSWHTSRSTSIFGNIAISALWERFDVKTRQAFVDGPVSTSFVSEFHTVNPVLEMILGLRWETWLCCNRYHFSAEGGWEFQWWNDQNHFNNSQGIDRLGDLYLQGFTGRLRFDF